MLSILHIYSFQQETSIQVGTSLFVVYAMTVGQITLYVMIMLFFMFS